MMIVSNFLAISYLTYLGKTFLSFRFDKFKSILLLFITFSLICSLNYAGLSGSIAFVIFIIFLIYVFIQFKENFKKKLFVIFSYYILTIISEIGCMLIMNALIGLDKSTSIKSFAYIFSLFVSNVVMFLLIKLYVKVVKNHYFDYFPKYSLLIFILPFVTIVLFMIIPDIYQATEQNKAFLFVIIGLVISNIVLMITFLYAIKSYRLQNELELQAFKDKYSSTKFALLDYQYKTSFEYLHSILDHCQKLSILLNENKINELGSELNTLTETTFKSFNNIYTNSLIMNTLINSRIHIINENDIKILSTLEYNDFTFIDFCDQIDIFSNILDFAIESTIECKTQKDILIKSKLKGKQIIIQYIFGCLEDKDTTDIIELTEKSLKCYNAFTSAAFLEKDVLSIIVVFFNTDLKETY